MTPTEATIAQLEPSIADLGKVTDSLGEAATVSIAITLKRLADIFEGNDGHQGIASTLFYMEQRLGPQS